MKKITNFGEQVQDNKVFVDSQKSSLENGSSITFNGKGNILFVEDGVRLRNSCIQFNGDNALVYLSGSKYFYNVNITSHCETCIFIGCNNYMNGKLTLITSERQNIVIGNNGLISFGILVRTADPHLVYSCESKQRLNKSKSVLIGDHVWLGQNALLLKGSVIGSGSILGGGSVVSNKEIPSNASAAGNPSKIISKNIFFSKECVHNFSEEQTAEFQVMNSDEWIYSEDSSQIGIKKIDELICAKNDAYGKLDVVVENIVKNDAKNRFYLAEKKEEKVQKTSRLRLFAIHREIRNKK